MMTLKDVSMWIETQINADVYKIGSFDHSKEKTICVRNLASNKGKLSIGGLENTSTAVKGIAIDIHWNKSPNETEQIAQELFALFYGMTPIISGWQTKICDMRNDEPLSFGIDDNGIYEFLIELWITYDRDRKE